MPWPLRLGLSEKASRTWPMRSTASACRLTRRRVAAGVEEERDAPAARFAGGNGAEALLEDLRAIVAAAGRARRQGLAAGHRPPAARRAARHVGAAERHVQHDAAARSAL